MFELLHSSAPSPPTAPTAARRRLARQISGGRIESLSWRPAGSTFAAQSALPTSTGLPLAATDCPLDWVAGRLSMHRDLRWARIRTYHHGQCLRLPRSTACAVRRLGLGDNHSITVQGQRVLAVGNDPICHASPVHRAKAHGYRHRIESHLSGRTTALIMGCVPVFTDAGSCVRSVVGRGGFV